MLFVLALFLVSSTFGQSEKTCDELGWSDEVKTGGLGVEGVCGTKGQESVCGDEMKNKDAETICTDMGARLCTQEEYEALEAFDSGCKYEKKGKFVWTSTDGEGCHMAVKLSQKGEATSECITIRNKAYGGRCCADVGEAPETDSPTMYPTHSPSLPPVPFGTVSPTMTPTVNPDDIDEIMAELMCIASSGSKYSCKLGLPESVGKCKWLKSESVKDRCQLKVFYGSCEGLNRKNCKKAVKEGRCEFADDDEKTCKNIEE